MKKVIILLVALVGMTGAMAQWVPQNSGTTNDLNSVFFMDVNTGYAVGDFGTILKTADGGENWEIKNSGTSEGLNSVFFLNENTGYVVGGNGTILKTADAGENWIPKVSGTLYGLSSIHFPVENIGYSVAGSLIGPGIILKTTDGGENWTSSEWGYNTILKAVYFINANTGFAVGQQGFMQPHGIILKTTNGGTEWTNTFTCGVEYASLYSICFIDADKGFVVGSNEYSGYIVKTSDGGITWTGNFIDIAQGLFFGYFPNANIGYAVGFDYYLKSLILKTTNGGIEWTIQYNGNISDLYLSSVHFVDENIGYIVGDSGSILKTTNGGTTGLNGSKVVANSLIISPNPSKDKITISSTVLTGNTQLSIFNVSGEKVIERLLTDNETQIDISALPQGVYFVRLQNEKMVEVGKMVKE